MTEELTTIARDGIDHDEFDSILNYLRGKTHISCETSSQVASYLGKQQLLYGSIETPDDKLQQYESLTLDQVNACASYLDPEKMFSYRIE
jgi:predicted Zn-dependent peptidase